MAEGGLRNQVTSLTPISILGPRFYARTPPGQIGGVLLCGLADLGSLGHTSDQTGGVVNGVGG